MLQAIFDRVSSIDQKVGKGFESVNQRIDDLDHKLTERTDKIGLQVARLEDDTPTIEDFEKLETKVTKLQRQVAKN